MSRLIIQPIESPLLPFIAEIPEGAKPGLVIRIQGNIPGNARRFYINLACGPIWDAPNPSDIAFHFNPRFDKGYVARNSFVSGSWGSEEGQSPSHLPLTRDRSFEIMLLVEEQQYKVAVDGAHFLEFDHRIPLSLVTTLYIDGDVQIYRIEFLDDQPAASIGYDNLEATPFPALEFFNPNVPFEQAIPGGFTIGRSIAITGRPKPYATRFSINLERDVSGAERDILFHLNPRFGGLGDERKSALVRNSRLGGVWGPEERDTTYFPFNHGFNFDLTILVEPLHFLVAVNGQHLVSYSHRTPFEMVNAIVISGDVDLVLVKVH